MDAPARDRSARRRVRGSGVGVTADDAEDAADV